MTEVLVGFGGVVLGWLLSQLGVAATDIRRVRLAARVLVAELGSNRGKLRFLREQGLWPSAEGPERSAWQAHRADVFWIADAECRGALVHAYQELDPASAIVKAGENSPFRVAELATGPQGVVLEGAIEAQEAAMLCLLPLCEYTLRQRLPRRAR